MMMLLFKKIYPGLKDEVSLCLIIYSCAFGLGMILCTELSAHADSKPSRSKVIDFEGDRIEGVNKLPLDSVNQISESNNSKSKPHLYQKRKSFHSENLKRVHELRYSK